jgi:TM2 domain-containing membrane protein YozV
MSQPPPRKLDPIAALLSYLVPGLGQIYQGRIGKGVLFLVCLLGLFFYGMWLGSFKNVFIPHSDTKQNVVFKSGVLGDLENRLHFVGQFWIGIAAWPAIVQYATYDPDPKVTGHRILGQWMRGPYDTGDEKEDARRAYHFQQDVNELQRDGDKHWDLGWVYTVIAGALNFLVIYDALAGPAVREPPDGSKPKEAAAA